MKGSSSSRSSTKPLDGAAEPCPPPRLCGSEAEPAHQQPPPPPPRPRARGPRLPRLSPCWTEAGASSGAGLPFSALPAVLSGLGRPRCAGPALICRAGGGSVCLSAQRSHGLPGSAGGGPVPVWAARKATLLNFTWYVNGVLTSVWKRFLPCIINDRKPLGSFELFSWGKEG